ncbi:cytochrome c oxidase subunit NDUFA4-like [Echinops telfairi]|uniref:Cytochrome c oxidase subunit NDUFA4-like n=1 Tax=Echinops telfairi TaxID=9371 RepID=A0AC55DJP6_ECHTE|nr:cytochrome c oxidase subunit NDUFA4-like [Echinops telfairi]
MLRQILSQARKQPSLIPLFVLTGAGGNGAAPYATRLPLLNPDVRWDGKNHPEPGNKLGPHAQSKFFAVNTDHSALKKEGPDFSMKCFPSSCSEGGSSSYPHKFPWKQYILRS